MIFSELYNAYYNAVASILKEILKNPEKKINIREMSDKYAFGESFFVIESCLKNGNWPLIDKNGKSLICNIPEMPLTLLQKQWLKAVFSDPRIKLFTDNVPDFPGIEPLYNQNDIYIFDKYSDGDDYTDEKYIKNFRLILDAIKNEYPLKVYFTSNKEKTSCYFVQPRYIEYSEKDDKFRVYTTGCKFCNAINIGRIISCVPFKGTLKESNDNPKKRKTKNLTFEVTDERNALERVLFHFAHFEKEAIKMDKGHYIVKITYDADDETEILIRILSFGPFIKITGPESFIDLIKTKLKLQKSCELK